MNKRQPHPGEGAAELGRARQLLAAGRGKDALRLADRAHEHAKDELLPLTLGARAAASIGDSAGALERIRGAIALRPRNVENRLLEAEILLRAGQLEAADALVLRIESSASDRPGALRRLARFHQQFGHRNAAMRVLRKALAVEPNAPESLYLAAILSRQQGRIEAARELCRRLSYQAPDHPGGWALRSTLEPASAGAHHLDALGFLLEKHNDAGPQRAFLSAAIGRELEDLGQFDPAFVSYLESAAVESSGGDRSFAAAAPEQAEHLYKALENDSATARQAPAKASAPLFLLGLPCEGMHTLQCLLSASADIVPIGARDWVGHAQLLFERQEAGDAARGAQLARAWTADRASAFGQTLRAFLPAQDSPWLLDGAPGRFRQFGLLHAALGDARFIHLRRDPLDQCLDLLCPPPGAPRLPQRSLKSLAAYFTDYQRLMGYWRRCFPGRMLEIDYAELVTDPQGVVVALRDFLALDDDALPVPELVTERPSERVGRASRFAVQLAPLREQLRVNGVPVAQPGGGTG